MYKIVVRTVQNSSHNLTADSYKFDQGCLILNEEEEGTLVFNMNFVTTVNIKKVVDEEKK